MSIYKSSTLAMIPTAYKDGKLYSVRPTDGSGDFTFSRGSNLAATRVASSGYIEKGRENLSLYSNTFSSWTAQSGGSVTSGQSGYDGTNDAWLLTSGAATYSRIERTISHTGVYTISVYAKAGTLGWLSFENSGISSDESYFDLTTGTLGSLGANVVTANIESVGSGWYRCSATLNGTSATQRIYPAVANGDLNSAQGNIYIQDFQFEQGLVATDYIETTTTSVSAGILEDMPRLDYSGGASCPSLLLEPQRTNKLSNSEYINSGSTWVEENGADCTPNYATSPEGVDNATRVQLDNSGAFSLTRIWSNFSPDASSDTASFYAKSNTGSSFDIVIYFRDAGFGAVRGNKTITITNEWQRFDLTADCSGAAGNVMFLIYNTTASENWDFLMYGAQVEAGSYPTSYIPTYGASVTRSVDSMSLTDLLGNDIVNTLTEGTLLLDLEVSGQRDGTASYRHFRMVDNTDSSTNRIRLWEGGAGSISTLRVDFTSGSIEESINADTQNKVAVSWDSSGTKIYKNGVNTDSSTSQLVFASTPKFLTSIVSNYRFNSILVFPTALTDTELASLTTL